VSARPSAAVVTGVAVVAAVVAVAEVWGHELPRGSAALLVLALTAAAVLAAAVARERPALAAAVTAGASVLIVAYGVALPWVVAAAAGVTAFVLVRSVPDRLAAGVVAVYALLAVAASEAGRPSSTVVAAVVATAAAGLGGALRWREHAARLSATAHDAERTLLEHVTLEERARIARELHDVVAHHISMIAVQSEAARLLVPDLAPDGERRLVEIGDTARAALTEMRRLLGVLREDGGAAAPVRQPLPGLAELDALVDEARAVAGATLRLIVHGPVVALDPGVELTAFRIVQEALTNARRHAPGSAVDVELDYRPEALHVRVRDSGLGRRSDPATAAGAGGHGLDGMRERAAMLGGTLSAGPLAGGGFAVAAVLPGTPEP
jgi:signal transduction histidine kinase